MNRRDFNKTLLMLTGVSAGATLSAVPLKALAAWPTDAFSADTVDAALNSLFGMSEVTDSGDIAIKAPDIAENGAVVPISVTSNVANSERVALLVVNNPSPLAATFDLSTPGTTEVSTRLKMGKSSELMAVVLAGGKLYSATSKEVKVTIGGCGG